MSSAKKSVKEDNKKEEKLDIRKFAKEIGNLKTIDQELTSDTKYCYTFDNAVIDIPMGGGCYGGKVYEYYGWESVGKSTFSLEIARNFCNYWEKQKEDNYMVVWMEAESALDRVRAKWMGIPIDTKFLIFEADTVEGAENLMKSVLNKAKDKKYKILFVWDTIAASTPAVEKEEGKNSGGLGLKARLVRQLFRSIINDLGGTHSTFVIVNQLHSTIGDPYKKQDTALPAIKFYASVRGALKASVHKEVTATGDEISPGIWTTIRYEKNKLIQRNQTSKIYINNENGIDHTKTLLDYLKRAKLIEMGGSWKTINIPKKLFKKGEKIEMVDYKFQSDDKVPEAIETQYPHLYDWMNYLVYRNYTTVSPLIKVKIIEKTWEYEKLFFGEKRTTLTEDEKEVAAMIIKDQNELQDKETSLKKEPKEK